MLRLRALCPNCDEVNKTALAECCPCICLDSIHELSKKIVFAGIICHYLYSYIRSVDSAYFTSKK